MRTYLGSSPLPLGFTCVATIGNFDGLHLGHKKLIEITKKNAQILETNSLLLSFTPHPRAVHDEFSNYRCLMSKKHKAFALENIGIDVCYLLDYNRQLYSLTPCEFIAKYIVGAIGAKRVVVGEDFLFGKNNSGDIKKLELLGKRFSFEVIVVSNILDEQGVRYSSTRIKKLISEGRIKQAKELLGWNPRITGKIVHGNKRGRTLGFPTANIEPDEQIVLPADGVYSGWLYVGDYYCNQGKVDNKIPKRDSGGKFYPAAVSLGINYQFDAVMQTIEAHLIGERGLDLYDKPVTLFFVEKLRNMEKFTSIDDLLAQMNRDIFDAKSSLSKDNDSGNV